MNNKFFYTLITISLLILLFPIRIYAESDNLNINSKYAILYNLDDDNIIYEKNADDRISVASLTKIMTCIVALENIQNLDDTIILNKNIFYGLIEANASVAGFNAGDKVSYRDLVMGALLPSGADATRALAFNISGSEEKFVELMNKKANDLGLLNTHLKNTTGLESANHYSSVKDISIILKYALQNDNFKKMYTTKEYTTTNNLKFYSTLKKISNNYSINIGNILGTKTGFTDEVGLCMSSIANYNGINYLLVTAGADYKGNTPWQLLDAITIYNYFKDNYSYKFLINENDYISSIKILYSKQNEYKVLSPITIKKYLNNSFDSNKLVINYNGLTQLNYKNKIGDKIGTVSIIYEDKIIDKFDVFLDTTISFDLFKFLIQKKYIYIIIFTCLFISFILINKLKKRHKKKKTNFI